MKKRVLAFLLGGMIAVGLAACGRAEQPSQPIPQPAEPVQHPAEPVQPAPAEKPAPPDVPTFAEAFGIVQAITVVIGSAALMRVTASL